MELPGKPPLARPFQEPPAWANDPETLELLKNRPGWTVAALTGGIASGKSVVSELFSLLGATVIDMDILAREVLQPGSAGLQATLELFGPAALTKAGGLNRSLIARKVFGNAVLRRQYEDIIHPLIWGLMGERLWEAAQAPSVPQVVIVVAPLLFESRLNPLFNPIILCFATPKTQWKRLRLRPGLGFWGARARLKSQWPSSPKIPQSQFIIDNQGDLSLTIRQVKDVYQKLLAWQPA